MRDLACRMLSAGIVLAASAAVASPAMQEVEYRADGSVRVDNQVFPTREAYHRSQLFQASGARCGSAPRDPALLDAMQLVAASDCTLNSTKINQDYNDSRTFVIPVVFHVIKKTDGTGDISPALLQSQIEILNQDFNAMANTPGAQGTNAKLQFTLAKLDPMGNPTTGFEVVTNNTYFNDPGSGGTNSMKRALKWDPAHYLNVYTNDAGGGGTLGYSTFPAEDAGGAEDGVDLNWEYVGRNPPGGAPYDMGRTATHEIGHYLGLFHTFQSGCGSASAPYTSGDLIGDTVRESQANYGCSPVSSGCGGMSPIENFMDYSEDACMTKFTPEQVNRIRCSIVNYRWINTPPTAAFTFTTSGLAATFTNTSTDAQTAATGLKYTWSFGDGTTSTDQNPTHAYAAAGTYNVSLDVLDPGSGTATTAQSVVVTASNPPGGDGDAGVSDPGNNGGDHPPSTEMGGCCQTSGGGASTLLCGVAVAGILGRRRRHRRR